MPFEPRDSEQLFLGDLDVYIDSETNPAFYTRPEKPISFNVEFAEFLEGIPQVLVRKDLVRFGLTMSLVAMEWTLNIMQIARGGELVTGGPTYDYLYWGTDFTEPPVHQYRFIGPKVNSEIVEFVMRRGKSTDFPELTSGGTDYNEIPFTIEALKDDTVSDQSRNLAYFRIEN